MIKEAETMPFTLSVIEDLQIDDEESSKSGKGSEAANQSGQ